MKDSVRAVFPSFSERFEGSVRWMYADVKGLITVAIGNLIDPIQMALQLPFVHADGKPASRDEIAADWLNLKQRTCIAAKEYKGGPCPWKGTGKVCLAHEGHLKAKPLARLSLTDEGVAMLVARKLEQNDAFLVKRFPDFEQWPADAQLSVHSLSWAAGPAFRFPKLEACLKAQSFAVYEVDADGVSHLVDGAAFHCHMNEAGNPGLAPRNDANVLLFENAASVLANGLDPEVLYWPHAALAEEPVDGTRIVHAIPDYLDLFRKRDCG